MLHKILILSLLVSSTVFGFSFKFNMFFKTGIMQYSGYRAYSDGTYAKNCYDYKNPTGKFSYTGAVGNGIYRVKQTGTSTLYDMYCDMTTDNGGWTLVQFDAGSTGGNSTTTSRAQGDSGYLNSSVALMSTTSTPMGAKFSSADMITFASTKEFQMRDSASNTYIIKYDNDIAGGGFSFTAMTNWTYQAKDSTGTYKTGCNGHYNMRGLNTYSDNNNDICPYVFSGSKFFYHSKHMYCGTGSAGSSYADYCYPGNPNRPVYVFIR